LKHGRGELSIVVAHGFTPGLRPDHRSAPKTRQGDAQAACRLISARAADIQADTLKRSNHMTVRAMPLIAGNWKMNGLTADGLGLAAALADRMKSATTPPCIMVLCPPATLLGAVAGALEGSGIHLGGQDCHAEPSGAFTGSVSAPMLSDLGCRYVIVGHSERRRDFAESDEQVAAKAAAALSEGLTPIICVGETLDQRDAGNALNVVDEQVCGSIPELAGDVVVAYEPVWAIGTGRTASAGDVAEVHGAIRSRLNELRDNGQHIPILYGGSANPTNAAELLATPEVGGLLVGGASLDADSFWQVATAG
jgi:triosephosphate isomerase